MTKWIPKHDAGFRTQWAPEVNDATWKESNILIYSTQIKQERLIHLENVYRYMHQYLIEEGYKSMKGDKWFEDFYGEYRDSEGHKEIRFWWRMKKNPNGIAGNPHPYFRERVFLDVLTTNMKRVEIMYKGKKIKPYVGEFIMWFNVILELDYQGWFKSSKLLNPFEDFFPRMIYKDRIREQEINSRRFAERFVEDVKFFIGLSRNSEARKPMEPEREWF